MKTRWFNANFPAGIDELYNSIVNTPFNSDKGWGFLINSYDRDVISSKYIEKVEVREVITDPYGNETEFKHFKYIQFNFWVYKTTRKNLLLIIECPPRSIKNFISSVIKATNSDFSVSLLPINVEDFISQLTNHFKNIQVHKAKLKGLTFSKNTSGTLELESSNDAIKEISDVFKSAKFVIEKVKLNIETDIGYESIEVNSNGSIYFSLDIFDRIFSTVEKLCH